MRLDKKDLIMPNKLYKIQEDTSLKVCEPAAIYSVSSSVSDKWNPNVPFNCTQDEFLEHIRRIEEGEFMSWEECKREHKQWKKEFLASRLK